VLNTVIIYNIGYCIMSFLVVEEFEKAVASFYNAPYAVATDCCTHAIELCLRYQNVSHKLSVPTHTYISIPMTLTKLNIKWDWRRDTWKDYYYVGNTNIIDAAVCFKRDAYVLNTFMCLSFQFKKPLSLGRGGAILCTSEQEYITLKKMTYDGRYGDQPWADQDIDTIGYHYYMTPETARAGLDKLPVTAKQNWPEWCWADYPDLTEFKVFK